MNGFFVSFEGVDCTGKTTVLSRVTENLREELNNDRVTIVEEFPPDYLDGYMQKLLENDIFLALSEEHDTPLSQTYLITGSHTFKYETQIKPALGRGNIVLTDRFIPSVYAYQVGELSEDQQKPFLSLMRKMPVPDLIFHMYASEEAIEQRSRNRGDILCPEDMDFIRRAAGNYHVFYEGLDNVRFINAEDSLDVIVRNVTSEILNMYDS